MLKHTIAGVAVLSALAAPAAALAEDNHIDTIRSDAPALASYGSEPVGVKTLQLVNPQQLDIAHAVAGQPIARYDRPLTVEVWYPATASAGTPGADAGHYRVMTRDGKTEVTLYGRAVRDAAPARGHGAYPLVILSHGYPGNRFLLSHLGENLASKGYVVASIDHTDSTYTDQGAFGSTLMNRSLDQLFVLNAMAKLNRSDPSGTLKGLVDADNTAIIGYSMGGYGVLNTLGAGLTQAAVNSPLGVPGGALAARAAGNASYTASLDGRIKAAVAFAPWGWNYGIFDAASLAAIKTPLFFVAGSADDVSGYAPGVRNLYEGTVHAPRYLLTFENANHNAGAPIPAPKETWIPAPGLKFNPAEHYVDAVWDSARMNNISQHFVTAFLAKYLKHDATMDGYLNLTPRAADGKWSVDAAGAFKPDNTYWKGFPNRTAVGLRLEQLPPQ